jgi:hypothetical protein
VDISGEKVHLVGKKTTTNNNNNKTTGVREEKVI